MTLETQKTLRTSKRHLINFSTAANSLSLKNIARCPQCASGRGLIAGLCEGEGMPSLANEVQVLMERILRHHEAFGKAVDDMMDELIAQVERSDDETQGP